MWSEEGLLHLLGCRRDCVVVSMVRLKPGARQTRQSKTADRKNRCGAQGGAFTPGGQAIVERSADGGERRLNLTDAEHAKEHPKSIAACVHCCWRRNERRIQEAAALTDPLSGKTITTILRSDPAGSSEFFCIGCSLCQWFAGRLKSQGKAVGEKHGSNISAFATFSVSSPACVIPYFTARHCNKSAFHKEAQQTALRERVPLPGVELSGFEGKTIMAVTTSAPDVEQSVPRVEKFVWAIRSCQQGCSRRDFEQFCEAEGLTSIMPDGVVLNDASRLACGKMLTSCGAVIDDQHSNLLRRACRLGFSMDDRDQVNALRVRLTMTRPHVFAKEFIADVARDYGHGIEECANSAWECLRHLAAARNGRHVPGEALQYDEALVKKISEITFCGATDGCEVAVQGVQLLKTNGTLPRLRYQFRDRPHTTRTICKGVLKHMQEGRALMEALVSGPKSFCKRARYSHRFRAIWLRKQKSDAEDFFNALQHLSHSECRYDSRSEPMSILCSKMDVVIEVLVEVANDPLLAHREDADWAKAVLLQISGPSGFYRLIVFAIECDFAVATHMLIAVQDQQSPDVSLTAGQVLDILAVCEALFHDGAIFAEEPNYTYTNIMLHSLRRGAREVDVARRGERERLYAQIGWPRESETYKELHDFSESLYTMCKAFFHLNFPDHSWRTKFAAFDCGRNKLPEALRLRYVEELAVKEGINKVQARHQFQAVIPVTNRLHQESSDNREVFSKLCEHFRIRSGGQFRADARPIVDLSLTFVGIMDGTGDVERTFAQLEMLELKRRVRHLSPNALKDALQVMQEVPRSLDALIIRAPQSQAQADCAGAVLQVLWKPRAFIAKAFNLLS